MSAPTHPDGEGNAPRRRSVAGPSPWRGHQTPALTRAEVEDLLYREAELLDAWDLDAWLGLYTDDARYVVPANDTPDGDPRTDLVLVDDDRLRMEARVERLNSRKAHREYPHSNCRHLVTNVRVGEPVDGEVPVRASFIVWRSRNGKDSMFVGGYEYRLVERAGEDADQPGSTPTGLRIRSKRVLLDMSSLRPANDVAIIL